MIILMGPAGAGKSIQGQMLASNCGWTWLSMGQMLRDLNDESINHVAQEGKLIPHEITFIALELALSKQPDFSKVVVDGFPRAIEQAKWLMSGKYSSNIEAVFLIDISRDEAVKRLALRARIDDTPEAIDERFKIFDEDTRPVIRFFSDSGVNVIHINGETTPEEVHGKIVEEINKCKKQN